MTENEDYELVPSGTEEEQVWDVRILKGEYTETVVRYGAVSVGDDDMLHFNFEVVVSPRGATEEEKDLQDLASQILLSIIENAIKSKDASAGE